MFCQLIYTKSMKFNFLRIYKFQDRSINNMQGSYVTISKDGTVNYWSLDLEKQRTEKSNNRDLLTYNYDNIFKTHTF